MLRGEAFDEMAAQMACAWDRSERLTNLAKAMDVIVALEEAGYEITSRDPGPADLEAALEASLKQIDLTGRVLSLVEGVASPDAKIVELRP